MSSEKTLLPNTIKNINSPAYRTDIYRKWLKNKFTEFDNIYWEKLDELREKLKDISSGLDFPELRLEEYAFISDWKVGKISSSQVYHIFRGMNIENVARTRVLRKLSKYMLTNDEYADYCKYTLQELKDQALPLYTKYLEMLKKYFEVLARIDSEQVQVTWLEQFLPGDAGGEIKTRICEIPFNQFVYQLDAFIIGCIENRYSIGDNVIVLDEPPVQNDDPRIIHWIFAPKSFTVILKEKYHIKEQMDEKLEKEYLKKLIENYK